MQSEEHSRYFQALRESDKSGHTLAADCYRDPAMFELEVEHVLRPGWHPLARWDELAEPGDYKSVDLFGEPLVVVRGEEGALRVFSRVCRHRAHTIVEGTGNTRTFVCPYHRWSYGLDGALRAAPLVKGSPSFDSKQFCLPELSTELWQGFLMVSLERDPVPFAAPLTALDERLASYRLGQMKSLAVLDFDSPWNWKVMVDNFMESYHHLGPHANSLQKSNPAKGTYCADLEGPFSLLENPSTSGKEDFLVAQVFPTLLFFVQQGSAVAGWYEMQIDRFDHFHLRIHTFAVPEIAEVEGAADMANQLVSEIHLEDIPVCESVQRGLSSRLWEPGPLTHYEEALARFHRYLEERLAPTRQ